MQHIRHIWPTIKDVADDLALPYTTVHSWSVRGRIPSDHDFALIEAAKARGFKLTLEELAAARRLVSEEFGAHPTSHANANPQNQGDAA